jgi:hypothetical protein
VSFGQWIKGGDCGCVRGDSHRGCCVDHLSRLIARVLLVMVGLVGHAAWAQQYEYRLPALNSSPPTAWHSTPQAAGEERCAFDLTLLAPSYAPCSVSVTGTAPSSYSVTMTFNGGLNYSQSAEYREAPPQDQCITLARRSANLLFDDQVVTGIPGPLMCHQGCAIYPQLTVAYGGQTFGSGWYFSGQDCTGIEAEPALVEEEAPEQCPPGQAPGTVNGTTVCVNAPATDAQPQVVENPDGSTTTTQTTCDGGQCTTTNTQRDNEGDVTGVSSSTQTQAQFCAANGWHPACGGAGDGEGEETESAFGGACEAGFTCEGDAIQCAIAREQHVRNCALFETPTDLSDAGNAAATGELHPDGHPYSDPESVNLSLSSRINQSPLFGGSTCPADVSITVMDRPVNVALSSMCGYLNLIGAAGVMVAMLVAGFIVFRPRG